MRAPGLCTCSPLGERGALFFGGGEDKHGCCPKARQLSMCVQGHRKMNPFCIPFAITNMGGALLAMDLGFMGPNYSISTACATGNYCITRRALMQCKGAAALKH